MQRVDDIEVTHATVLPRHRHGVLRLLMEQLRRARMPAARAAQYVRAVERQVYAQSAAARQPYMRLARTMAFNLGQNGAYLSKTYPPHRLPQLDHTLLAKTTPMESWYQEHLENKSKEEEILRAQPTDFLEDDDGTSLMQCSKCHSSNIVWEQKQTRGADESMTIFCQCKDCGKRWKMS